MTPGDHTGTARTTPVVLAVLAGLTLVPALVLVLALQGPAAAHGYLDSSDPVAGSILDEGPAQISLRFTEEPEPRFSSIEVLGEGGRSFGEGEVSPAAGDPSRLTLSLGVLPRGVYTVSWRIVSRVDGHLTAGTFAFGVQEPVTAELAAAGQQETLAREWTPAAVGGRALFYSGVAVLTGVAWVGALLLRERPPSLRLLATVGWAAAAVGVAGIGVAQRSTAGVDLSTFLESPVGRSVLWRGAGVVVAGLGVGWWLLAGSSWRAGSAAIAAGALAAVVAHVDAGHAAAFSPAWVAIGGQVVHVAAIATWIGGLAALLIGIGRRPPPAPEASSLARRFSTVAAVALAVAVVTGVMRAIVELRGWQPLFDLAYGRLVLVKSALVLVVAGLGAVNRFRSVPATGTSTSGLRRVGGAELAVAGAVLVVAGLLTTAPPPDTASAGPEPVEVSTTDFGTTLRARATLEPGRAGHNQLTVRLHDYDSGEPVEATRVTSRLDLPAHPEVSPSPVVLEPDEPGTYSAAANLPVPGRWRLAIVVERGGDSTALNADIVTREPSGTVTETPGDPTVYTLDLGQGRSVQVYLDPDQPGPADLHATFFGTGGGEEPIERATVWAGGSSGTPRRLGPGHFVAEVEAAGGEWPVEIAAVTAGGDYLWAPLSLDVGAG